MKTNSIINKTISNLRSGLTASVITTGLFLGVASAFAADSPSGNIALSGTVPPVNIIAVATVAGYDTLDMAAGVTDKQVATVNEKNNCTIGYTVTLQSANAGSTAQAFLKGTGTATNIFNYTMKYGTAGSEAAVTLDTGSAVVTSTDVKSIEAGAEKSLLISFTGSTWKNADTYTDTITLTIAAK